jgi:UTP--glucose-1-phosphate uridylyltransferase
VSVRGALSSVIVPAAGLGTRLAPLTLGAAKELLPLGAYPALTATVLEAAAAGLRELVVVTAPPQDKPQLGRFFAEMARLGASAGMSAGTPAAAALAQLFAGVQVQLVEQPAPLGVLDAVERGLARTAAPCAVLFPDLIHLPDQTGLTHLCAAHAACGQAVIGLRRRTPAAAGNTVAVTLRDGYRATTARPGEPLPIVAVRPAAGEADELLTTLGQIHTPALGVAIESLCRAHRGAPLEDARFIAALDHLAREGRLYGTLLPGEVIDLGSLPGYLDAAARFATGAAALRGLPPVPRSIQGEP